MGSSEPLLSSTGGPRPPSPLQQVPISVWFGCVLAWLGVCLSFLLLHRESGLYSFICPARGGCETVLRSQFAEVYGVPLPWLGACFYLSLLGLWLGAAAIASLRLRLRVLDSLLWLVLVGLTFSAGLMYVQFAVLHAFCPLCTASACNVAALLVVVWRARKAVTRTPAGASLGAAATLALFAIFPVLILAAESMGEKNGPGRLWAVDLSTAHRLGPAGAPVQLVVFSDFQCAFCRQVAPVLEQLHREFPQDVSIVFRHFPLDRHSRAFAAAMAAECAGEQGAFWQYHDKLFAEGGGLDDAKLLALASSLGLDAGRFGACLQSARPRQAVEENLREAQQLALPGTPAVFLNGRPIAGPLTHDNLAKQIKHALAAPPRAIPPWQ